MCYNDLEIAIIYDDVTPPLLPQAVYIVYLLSAHFAVVV